MNTEFKMPQPVQFRGWDIQVVEVTPENAAYLSGVFDGETWRDNLLRPIGIKFKADWPGDMEFAKYGHYIMRQTKTVDGEQIVLTMVVNACTAKHTMAQLTRRSA